MITIGEIINNHLINTAFILPILIKLCNKIFGTNKVGIKVKNCSFKT